MAVTRIAGPVLVDGHVHLHESFDLARFLSSAAENLRRQAPGLGVPPSRTGVLLLTEGHGEGAAERLERASGDRVPGWTITPGADGLSFRAVGSGDAAREVLIVRGYQVVTDEDLEVQAIGCARAPARGLPLEDMIRATRDAGAAAVLPWGFGKWLGRRGRLVRDALDSFEPGEVLLAASGGRLRGAAFHRLLREAPARGIPVVSGSDPLPFPREERVVGGNGFLFEGDLDADRAGAGLAAALRELRTSPALFGSGRGLIEFAGAQVEMQWRKRGPGSRRSGDSGT